MFLFIRLCLAVWVCIKKGSENMVLVMLLQIGAKDFTVMAVLIFLDRLAMAAAMEAVAMLVIVAE